MNTSKQRKSNIELLRILAMLMIIDVHYFASCNAGAYTIPGSGNWLVFHGLESLGICGVNIFVLITGFFSVNQRSIKPRKMLSLLIDVAFWGGLGFALCVLAGWKSLDVKTLIKTMFPILFGGRWFVKAYLVLLCLIPFINIILRAITQRSYLVLLIISALLFSIWPSFLPNPPLDDYGYGFVHFVFLYLIAAYIRLYVKKYPPKWLCLAGYIMSAVVVCAGSMLGESYAWAYNYVFVVTEAVSLLLFFIQLDIQSSRVNQLAACAFGVFLIHTDGFFSVLIYERVFHCTALMNGNPVLFLISAIGSLPVFYLVGFILESGKKKLFSVSIDKWLDKVNWLNQSGLITEKEK